jgi:hypothetical protein
LLYFEKGEIPPYGRNDLRCDWKRWRFLPVVGMTVRSMWERENVLAAKPPKHSLLHCLIMVCHSELSEESYKKEMKMNNIGFI